MLSLNQSPHRALTESCRLSYFAILCSLRRKHIGIRIDRIVAFNVQCIIMELFFCFGFRYSRGRYEVFIQFVHWLQ